MNRRVPVSSAPSGKRPIQYSSSSLNFSLVSCTNNNTADDDGLPLRCRVVLDSAGNTNSTDDDEDDDEDDDSDSDLFSSSPVKAAYSVVDGDCVSGGGGVASCRFKRCLGREATTRGERASAELTDTAYNDDHGQSTKKDSGAAAQEDDGGGGGGDDDLPPPLRRERRESD